MARTRLFIDWEENKPAPTDNVELIKMIKQECQNWDSWIQINEVKVEEHLDKWIEKGKRSIDLVIVFREFREGEPSDIHPNFIAEQKALGFDKHGRQTGNIERQNRK